MANPYSDKTRTTVWARSAGRCAFTGCGLALIVESTDGAEPSLVGQMAHIVGKSRQGPRGLGLMTDEARRSPDNFILLCGAHHKLVDDHPRLYPTMVLRRMKAEHERQHGPGSEPTVVTIQPERAPERLFSTMLTPMLMPGAIYSARTTAQSNTAIQAAIRHTPALTPFYLHEGRLYSFYDLADSVGPFAPVVKAGSTEQVAADEAWDDPDWFRRYVTLLNKGMTAYLWSRVLRFDHERNRHYFATHDQRPRTIQYQTITGRSQTLDVVHQERFRDGREKQVWWHQAVRLRWERIDTRSWYLTIRPEFHLTLDTEVPLAPKRIGRRVTRRKSTMYNGPYLQRVHFWRWFLANGEPRMVLNFGQPVIVDTSLAETEVLWPGVPGDDRELAQPMFEETLLTHARLLDALGNVDDWEELIA